MNKSKRSVEEKLSIVLEGLKDGSSVVELCRKYAVSQSQYYRWRDLFIDGGKRALETNRISAPEMQLQQKIKEYEQIIGKQAVQIELLKKQRIYKTAQENTN